LAITKNSTKEGKRQFQQDKRRTVQQTEETLCRSGKEISDAYGELCMFMKRYKFLITCLFKQQTTENCKR